MPAMASHLSTLLDAKEWFANVLWKAISYYAGILA